MDAIVGESFVARTHSDRNPALLDTSGVADKSNRKKRSGNASGQQTSTYGVSIKKISNFAFSTSN